MFRSAVVAALIAAAPAYAAPQATMVEAEGTAFRVTLADGRVLHSPDLVGATLGVAMNGKTFLLRIDGVERDPLDKHPEAGSGEVVWLHDFVVQQADGSWMNPCIAGPDGRRQGFVLAGRAGSGATLHEAPRGEMELVCTGGAQAKCVRFGYLPWGAIPDGTAMRDTYNACVRMVRGDYAGGDPRTRTGMLIDFWDRHGITTPDKDESLVFEAGWSPEGAVCVHHPRVAENATLAELEAVSPRLRGRTGEICTEEFARAHGALLFNRSRP
jgi:hypothetical protein